jgi:hypothetical protein
VRFIGGGTGTHGADFDLPAGYAQMHQRVYHKVGLFLTGSGDHVHYALGMIVQHFRATAQCSQLLVGRQYVTFQF